MKCQNPVFGVKIRKNSKCCLLIFYPECFVFTKFEKNVTVSPVLSRPSYLIQIFFLGHDLREKTKNKKKTFFMKQ